MAVRRRGSIGIDLSWHRRLEKTALFGDAYQGRRVLVTGHTGFKGGWLCAWLRRLGAVVCGYSDQVHHPSLFDQAGLVSTLRHQLGDVRDRRRLKEVIEDFRPDYIFHLAAQAIVSTSYSEPLETVSVNVMGTATVLDVLRFVDWPCVAVMITSDKVYDNVEWIWGYRENDRLGGRDIYSGSKGGAELAIRSYYDSFFTKDACPVRIVAARAGNVIGGGDWARDRIVADCVRAWLNKDVVEIRSPTATRPWQHVLEPLSGYLTLGAQVARDPSFDGQAFNFGPRPEQNATVVELIKELGEVWGLTQQDEMFRVTDHIPFHEAGLLKLNVDKAQIQLKWAPTLSYRECMEMTGSWYRDVMRTGADAAATTDRQVAAYESLAKARGLAWAAA